MNVAVSVGTKAISDSSSHDIAVRLHPVIEWPPGARFGRHPGPRRELNPSGRQELRGEIDRFEQVRKMDEYLRRHGFSHVATLTAPGREGKTFPFSDLELTEPARRLLATDFPRLWGHQRLAIQQYLRGQDVCLSTGTASGKSLPFQVAAVEALAASSQARVLALYPTKALGWQQAARFESSLEGAGLDGAVGRLDGQVPMPDRLPIVQRSRVLVATPDILHAWVMSRLGEPAVVDLLRHLSLVVIDEVHCYAGVFGSNAAFLFRRLRHCAGRLGAFPRFFAASATIAEPASHLAELVGTEFSVVGPEEDTSGRHQTEITLVRPPPGAGSRRHITALLRTLAEESESRFIAFLDSRKSVELVSSRLVHDSPDCEEVGAALDALQGSSVLPFRAGYEEHDRETILARLASGSVRGIVSTSALEIGLDVPDLDLAVLVGVPHTSTRFVQRLGRVGRARPGRAILIEGRSLLDTAVFQRPGEVFLRPPVQGALHLANPRIQYMHVLCLARKGGEDDQITTAVKSSRPATPGPSVQWPQGFLALCEQERTGVVAPELATMKSEAGADPHHTLPLRDLETQFLVGVMSGPQMRKMGHLSYAQLMREAYPGAVYYYAGQPHRVLRVQASPKAVHVRREKPYVTVPITSAPALFPRTDPSHVRSIARHEDLLVVECDLSIRESVRGFHEYRGSLKVDVAYPQPEYGQIQPFFTRFYSSTGVLLIHPLLDHPDLDSSPLARVFLEAFLLDNPFDANEVSAAVDIQRKHRGFGKDGSRVLVLFDRTYGSLRLSSRLLESGVLETALRRAHASVEGASDFGQREALLRTFEELSRLAALPRKPLTVEELSLGRPVASDASSLVRVVMPGSKGVDVRRQNEEFHVEKIVAHPTLGGLAYQGRHASTTDRKCHTLIPLASLAEIPGESDLGLHDPGTGRTVPAEWMSVPRPAPTIPPMGEVPSSGHSEVGSLRALIRQDATDWNSLGAIIRATMRLAVLRAPEASGDLIALFRRDEHELAVAAADALGYPGGAPVDDLLEVVLAPQRSWMCRAMAAWASLAATEGDAPGRSRVTGALVTLLNALVRPDKAIGWAEEELCGSVVALLAELAYAPARGVIQTAFKLGIVPPHYATPREVEQLYSRGCRGFRPLEGRLPAGGGSREAPVQPRGDRPILQALHDRWRVARELGFRLSGGEPFILKSPLSHRLASPGTKVGRNDRCPCGSGKKYKKCCIGKVIPDLVAAERDLQGLAAEASIALQTHGARVVGAAGLEAAWEDFWGGNPPGSVVAPSSMHQLFMPWFLYHWTPDVPGFEAAEGSTAAHTIAGQLLRSGLAELDSALRDYLEAARSEPLTFWQVVAIPDGETLQLRDLVTGRTRVATVRLADCRVYRWSVILGHVVSVEGASHLCAAGPLALPAGLFLDDILVLLKAFAIDRARHAVDLLEHDFELIQIYLDCAHAGMGDPGGLGVHLLA